MFRKVFKPNKIISIAITIVFILSHTLYAVNVPTRPTKDSLLRVPLGDYKRVSDGFLSDVYHNDIITKLGRELLHGKEEDLISFVIIDGMIGTGKTVLAHELIEYLKENYNILYISSDWFLKEPQNITELLPLLKRGLKMLLSGKLERDLIIKNAFYVQKVDNLIDWLQRSSRLLESHPDEIFETTLKELTDTEEYIYRALKLGLLEESLSLKKNTVVLIEGILASEVFKALQGKKICVFSDNKLSRKRFVKRRREQGLGRMKAWIISRIQTLDLLFREYFMHDIDEGVYDYIVNMDDVKHPTLKICRTSERPMLKSEKKKIQNSEWLDILKNVDLSIKGELEEYLYAFYQWELPEGYLHLPAIKFLLSERLAEYDYNREKNEIIFYISPDINEDGFKKVCWLAYGEWFSQNEAALFSDYSEEIWDSPYVIFMEEQGYVKGEEVKGKKVLDGGTGLGIPGISVAEEEAKEVICLDVSDSMLEKAKHEADKRKLTNISFQKGAIFNMPFTDRYFDMVFVNKVFYRQPIELRKMALKEILRVLKPGGKIKFLEADKPDYNGFGGYGMPNMKWDDKEWTHELEKAGFRNIRISGKQNHGASLYIIEAFASDIAEDAGKDIIKKAKKDVAGNRFKESLLQLREGLLNYGIIDNVDEFMSVFPEISDRVKTEREAFGQEIYLNKTRKDCVNKANGIFTSCLKERMGVISPIWGKVIFDSPKGESGIYYPVVFIPAYENDIETITTIIHENLHLNQAVMSCGIAEGATDLLTELIYPEAKGRGLYRDKKIFAEQLLLIMKEEAFFDFYFRKGFKALVPYLGSKLVKIYEFLEVITMSTKYSPRGDLYLQLLSYRDKEELIDRIFDRIMKKAEEIKTMSIARRTTEMRGREVFRIVEDELGGIEKFNNLMKNRTKQHL
ncbi:MAG: methyltransferase domain-containing protein [Planctomycetota bacterium]|jgi:ubiquinone/menaquinone biosynthesis C-methylase UbiE/uridine kinase